jgi:hypothetical protein
LPKIVERLKIPQARGQSIALKGTKMKRQEIFSRNLILLTPVKSNLLVRKMWNEETGGTSAKHISYVKGFKSRMSVAPG